MRLFPLLAYYFWWHYTTALEDLVGNYLNLAVFIKNFFSLGHLTRHLIAPWRRLGEKYPEKFNAEDFFSALIVNTLMRLVGLIARLVFLIAGTFLLLLSLLMFFIILVVWLLLPFVIVFLVIFGFRLWLV